MGFLHEEFHHGDDEHELYQNQGYVLWQPFLSDAATEFLRAQVDRVLRAKHDSISPEWIMNAHLLGETWLLDLAREPRLLDALQLFCGPDISLLQTHLFCKPQGCSATPWHQDGSSAEDIPLATVWITLDDITPPFSGGLVVLPGQHKHNLLPSEASDHFQFDRILPATYIAQQSPFRYPLGAGHAAIHHQWLPHASEPNLTLNYRRVIVLRFISTSVLMAEGVALWSIRNDGELARKCAIEEDGEAELYPDFRQEDVFIEGRNIILRGAH